MDRWIGKTKMLDKKVRKCLHIFFLFIFRICRCVEKILTHAYCIQTTNRVFELCQIHRYIPHMQISASLLIDLLPFVVYMCVYEGNFCSTSFLFLPFPTSTISHIMHVLSVSSNIYRTMCCMHLMVDKHWKLSIPFSFPFCTK